MVSLYRDGIVHADTLEWEFLPQHITLTGEVALNGEIVVAVHKIIRVLSGSSGDQDAIVETMRYAYNAHVRGKHNIRRDDNAHPHAGHPDDFHRHEYNWQTGEDLPGSPRWIGRDGWPSLGHFILAIHDWWTANYHDLPNPSGVAELNARITVAPDSGE
jgi:hypothetical protein